MDKQADKIRASEASIVSKKAKALGMLERLLDELSADDYGEFGIIVEADGGRIRKIRQHVISTHI